MKKFWNKMCSEETGRGVASLYLLVLLIPMLIWGILMIWVFMADYLDDIKNWCKETKIKIGKKFGKNYAEVEN